MFCFLWKCWIYFTFSPQNNPFHSQKGLSLLPNFHLQSFLLTYQNVCLLHHSSFYFENCQSFQTTDHHKFQITIPVLSPVYQCISKCTPWSHGHIGQFMKVGWPLFRYEVMKEGNPWNYFVHKHLANMKYNIMIYI